MGVFGTGKITLFTAATSSHQKRPTEEEIRKWQGRLDSYAARVLDTADVQVATKVDYEAKVPVPQRILKAAHSVGAGYIIIANRGHSKFREVLMGSTVTNLLQQTDLPVFLIKLRQEQEPEQEPDSSGHPGGRDESFHSGEGGKTGESDQSDDSAKIDIGGEGSISRKSDNNPKLRCTAPCKDALEHILYPTDFSDTARLAFDVLCRLAGGPSKRITLFHVQASGKVDLTNAAQLEEFNRIDHERLETLSREIKAQARVDVDIALGQGPAAKLIVDKARLTGATMILMGSQGRGYISDLFLGGVTFQVLRNTKVPVLVIPARRFSSVGNQQITGNEFGNE